jgi:NhaP-type Na+/H+ or K+/H+ antiporter
VALRPLDARRAAARLGAGATDGAAIFALLRGSTLKRRLATTLEGESGFNDPWPILLVLGFIEWLTHDDYGHRRHGVLFVRQLWDRPRSSASWSGPPRCGRCDG